MQLDLDGKASQSKALQQEAKLQMLSRVARTPNNIKSTASAQPPRKTQAPLSNLHILKGLSHFSSLSLCLFSLLLERPFPSFALLIPTQFLCIRYFHLKCKILCCNEIFKSYSLKSRSIFFFISVQHLAQSLAYY